MKIRVARDERPRFPNAEQQRAITELQLRRLLGKLARDLEQRPPKRSAMRRVLLRMPWTGPALARAEALARARELFTADQWHYIENAAAELGAERHSLVIGRVLAETGHYRVEEDGTLWACTPSKECA